MSEVLCKLSDLEATGGKGFTVTHNGETLPAFVVTWEGKVYGYINSCPHARSQLNWQDDTFFDFTKTLLLCGTHGAHFDPVTGACVRGLCKGKSLTPFPMRVVGDTIVAA